MASARLAPPRHRGSRRARRGHMAAHAGPSALRPV